MTLIDRILASYYRYFYQSQPASDLVEIDVDLNVVSIEIMNFLEEVHS